MGDEKNPEDLTQEGRKPDDEPKLVDPNEQATGGQGPPAETGDTGDEAAGTGPSGGGEDAVSEH